MRRPFLEENFYIVKETLILIGWMALALFVTFLLGHLARYVILKDLPFFGDVAFGDFKSTLIFCAEVAIILVYVVRPLYNLVSWAMRKQK